VLPFPTAADAPEIEKPKEDDAKVDPAVEPDKGRITVPGLHRSILGMLDELPAPKTRWSKEEQADWLDAVATLFQVIYKSDDKGDIRLPTRQIARPNQPGFFVVARRQKGERNERT
jgi:hypothetical protein